MVNQTDINNLLQNWNSLKSVAIQMNVNEITRNDSIQGNRNDSINTKLTSATQNINNAVEKTKYENLKTTAKNNENNNKNSASNCSPAVVKNLRKEAYDYNKKIPSKVNAFNKKDADNNRNELNKRNDQAKYCEANYKTFVDNGNRYMNEANDYDKILKKSYPKTTDEYNNLALKDFNKAKSIYDDTYNYVYSNIKNISTQGVTSLNTAVTNATDSKTIDNKALPNAQQLDTKTSINNNITQSNTIISTQKDVYNSVLKTTNLQTGLNNAVSAKQSGGLMEQKSIEVKTRANELSTIANQQKKLKDDIDAQTRFNSDTKKFIDSYIKKLEDANSKFTSFKSTIANIETNSKKIINNPLNKTPLQHYDFGNVDLDNVAKMQKDILSSKNGNSGLINIQIDSVESYPSKCIGITEYSKTSSINMYKLDNNLHTFKSCKVSANVAKKPYYALVKPQTTDSTNSNLYNCYVSDEAPPDNVPTNDYAIIWEHGPNTSNKSVINFFLDVCGNFMVTYSDNTTGNISKINTDLYSGCKFYLQLVDNGNIEIHSYGCNYTGVPEIAWQSLSIQSIQQKLQSILPYGPIQNKEWQSQGAANQLNGQKPSNTILISPNGNFKLEVTSDGNLQLKTTIYGCKYTDTVQNNAKISDTNFLYTDSVDLNKKGQSYYAYANDNRLPNVQTPYYFINVDGNELLKPIDNSNPSLINSNDYTPKPGYFMSNDINNVQNTNQVQNVSSEKECLDKCNDLSGCNYTYFYNRNQCFLGTKKIPDFVPNNNSTLYIRKKKMNYTENPENISPLVQDVNSALSYSSYNIVQPITTSFRPGKYTHPKFIALQERNNEIMLGKESFNNYNYYNPEQSCTTGDTGCIDAISRGQVIPLSQMAQDYQNQNSQMNTNRANITNAIDQYQTTYNSVNSNIKYDFSANQPFTMEDTSIQNVMQQDTKQLLLQENNFYIAGSLLTATLLITAIYLAR
jgi:hypothetical protein